MTVQRQTSDAQHGLVVLARELGVQTEYRDIEGRRVRATRPALRAIVGALGAGLEGVEDALSGGPTDPLLGSLRARRSARLLDPVHVMWDGAPVPVKFGELREGHGPVRLELTLEDGELLPAIEVDRHDLAHLPGGLPLGYHELVAEVDGRRATSRVICAPRQVYRGNDARAWGVFLPLYAARSSTDWGIGDLGSARALLELVGEAGGTLVGSTPLLATFLDEPFEPSPYAPVSRRFWNEAYVELERIPEFDRSPSARELLRDPGMLAERRRLRRLTHVDHRAVAALKRQALEGCAIELLEGSGSARRSAFDSWVAANPLVADYAAFRAECEAATPRAAHATLAAADHYHRYAQWCMDSQLAEVTGHTGAGLYLDLPLGVHADGFDRAAMPHLFAAGVSIGAPPDPLAEGGQDWGLPPLHPERIREDGYRYVIECTRHLFRHAAAVRIDHVMGMHRLFWIPCELGARQGLYVGYDADEQWAIICLESVRNRCMVVGEDLGTVPAAVRERMDDHAARRMYVMQFELDGTPASPEPIRVPPTGALASINTHDTPTWAAAWADLAPALRDRITASLADEGVTTGASAAAVGAAALRHLARGPAGAVIANLEDLWGELQPQNVPGTSSSEAPNWVRKSARTVEELRSDEGIATLLRSLTRLREEGPVTRNASPDVRYDLTLLSSDDVHLFNEGTHTRLHQCLGAHTDIVDGEAGTGFAVWAPNAEQVSVIGDFNGWQPGLTPLEPRDDSGIWEGFVPGVTVGEHYKYHVVSAHGGHSVEKADPFARYAEQPPRTASIVWDDDYAWGDSEWMSTRAARNALDAPISVYEMHAGSWMRVPEEGDRPLTYRELAPRLIEHLQRSGFTHVQFLPLMEHPFTGSWGYQTTGYFAPTSRYGTPDDLKFLVDQLHQSGFGVLLDWVPSHFPTDEHGLQYFDGTHLFEHADPRQGFHPDWKSSIFNLQRNEVRSFLLSSAMYWLEEFHADGLRVDAVASMLYLDYSREHGEWIPNVHGGRENLEAISLLRQLNSDVYAAFPDVQMIAEESTAWGGVSRPTWTGGLGFGMKWDMGWMHDTLEYFHREPIHRRHHQSELTFRQVYAYTENFMLPLSHDEVVHGKGSLIEKMPGDEWQRFANLRLLLSYMWTLPGKKLLFMGCEFGQYAEWNHDTSLDWHLLDHAPHQGLMQLVADLNRLYRDVPAMHQLDLDSTGFSWTDTSDEENSVFSYMRHARRGEGAPVLVVLNATPVLRHNYRVGVPTPGTWREVFNSDAHAYWGGGHGNGGAADTTPVPIHGHGWSLNLTLPPLGCVVLQPDPDTEELEPG